MRYRVIKTLVIYLLFATLEVWLHRCIGSGTGDLLSGHEASTSIAIHKTTNNTLPVWLT